MAFKYMPRTQEDVARRTKQQSGAYDSFLRLPQFKPKAGENCIRIVPWLSAERPDAQEQASKWGAATSGLHWGIDILVHYNVGGDEQAYLCRKKMLGEPCPPCEAREESEDRDERSKLSPTARVLCWLIDCNDRKAGIQPWAMPITLSKDISKASQLKGEGGWLQIDHPFEGYDMFFDKEGEGLKTKYSRAEAAREQSPITPNATKTQEYLNFVDENFLPELLRYYDYDHMESVLFGGASSKDTDTDETPRPRRASTEEDTAPREREESIPRGRRATAEAEPETPRRGEPAAGPKENPPWEGQTRDHAAEQAQEGKEAAADAPRRRFTPEPETKNEPAPADEDRSADAARTRLAAFRERTRR